MSIYSDWQVTVWKERDRLHIHLFDGDENNTIADWWDDDAREMIEDGFFDPRNMADSVIRYAIEMKLA